MPFHADRAGQAREAARRRMRGGNAHDARRNRAIDHGREDRFAVPLRHLDLRAGSESQRFEQRAMHPGLRRLGIGSALQRGRAPHQRVGGIDGNVRHALDRGRRGGRLRDRRMRRVGQAAANVTARGQYRCTHFVRGVGVESRQLEQRAQDPQHLPARPRFAQRRHDAMETLHAPFAAHERAGRFRERRNGQQDVGVRGTVPERTHHDDQLGLFQRGASRDGIGEIEFGFGVQHEVRLARVLEHRAGVHATCLRPCLREMRADGIGRVGQEAQRRARQFRKQLRERVDLRSRRVLHRIVAEQDRRLLARQEARGDRLGGCGRFDARERRGHRLARRLRRRDHDARELRRKLRWRDNRLVLDAQQPVVVDRVQHRDLRALLRRLPQPLRDQRMVLAQEAAYDQRAVEGIEFRDGHPQPGRGARAPHRRGNRFAAAGNRCCRSSVRAPGARPAPAPPAWREAKPALPASARRAWPRRRPGRWRRIRARSANRRPSSRHLASPSARSAAPRN